ncbi:M14 family metallopeptidase [Mucilaginibacter sp. RS28]|uniref:M14 family metallopeptidase n=1 Tax=Mucilaginibacter straminoryzae TaxID=2932774 RepID=A0A9X1WZ08_9SPHI|nr:M14 family metallopeptidase [Mucilaginibacter straminoryzae]MCJ8208257.1 M14 family metallopeptidase [Mucilaginibacter straminoryzae]
MIKRFYSLLVLGLLMHLGAMAQQLQSPSEFLGYALGERYTPHYRIIEYFRYVAATAKNVKLQQYGTTNEGRPLVVAYIASADNFSRLEEIRKNNLRLAGIEKGAGTTGSPAVVWLSYNVHGNEPASSEAAMATLYDLANTANAKTQAWLKNAVVVIDPCLNPDGRDRYVNFYNSVRGETPDAYNLAREHMEPWPGGRVNHYYFDLNRDWAWQTQKEVQARVALYNQWLPQVHVDFHEQGYNSPYYFAPAAEPFHKVITPWQREFQTTIGKNNAKYFDEKGWMYFTKEEFDLLYPSYGDTYPTYNGSVGMTYEQGGISGGLAVNTRSGDTLTLAQRVEHHHATGLSTVEITAANAARVITEYKKFFDNSRLSPPGDYKGYVVKNDNPDNLAKLEETLKRNGINYEFGTNRALTGFNYFNGKTESFTAGASDLVISAYQPKSVLLSVLMEPKTFVADSNTYDITAWALPYAYGLKTYGVKEAISGTGNEAAKPSSAISNTHAYAYVAPWKSTTDAAFLAALMKAHIKVRYTEAPFDAQGTHYSPGTLIIPRAGNDFARFDQTVQELATRFGRQVTGLSSGFVDKGADIGSSIVHSLRAPKVALLSGDGVDYEAMGEVWHFFEQQLHYPATVVRLQDLGRIRLADFDVVVMPDGGYSDLPAEKLQQWVKEGGRLIALGSAINALSGKPGFSVKSKEDKKDDKTAKNENINRVFGDRNREALKSTVPGAIYKVSLDNTHPLGFGYPNYYYTLKLSDDLYEYLDDDGWNVGTLKKNAYVSGFVGQTVKAKLQDGMLFGVQGLGRGNVVYLTDDPLFRSFWQNGKLLFANAVFMVGN